MTCLPDLRSDAGHHGHGQHHVVGISQLDADLGERGPNGTHAEWQYIHGPSLHAARPAGLVGLSVLVHAHPLAQDASHALLDIWHRGALLPGYHDSLALNTGHISGVCTAHIAENIKYKLTISFRDLDIYTQGIILKPCAAT